MKGTSQTTNTPFTVVIKAPGIDISRAVDETRGRRLIAILLGAGDDKPEDEADDKNPQDSITGQNNARSSINKEKFFASHQHEKPSENAVTLTAYHYAEYGSAAFNVDEMRTLAEEVGMTIPERLDMTYLSAKRNGNSLFRRAGRGVFRPTVHGESFFRQTYNIAKGTKRKDPNTGE